VVVERCVVRRPLHTVKTGAAFHQTMLRVGMCKCYTGGVRAGIKLALSSADALARANQNKERTTTARREDPSSA